VTATVVVTCLLALVSGAVPTWLLFKLKAEFRDFKQKAMTEAKFSEENQLLCDRINELENRIAAFEYTRDEHTEWIAQAESLNLNRRGQVLRLHRRGESVPGIASALRMGQGEVTLMIKVYELGHDLRPEEL